MSIEEKLPRFYYKKSRLQQLKGFCKVAQLKSISEAAKKMQLTTSAVSVQIKSLEKDLGVKLFTRSRKAGLLLTEKGKTLYNLSINYIYAIDDIFEKFLFAENDKYQNSLRIAVHQAVGSYILPKYIRKLLDKKEFKDIKITICNIPRKEAFKRLLSKEIDFAFYSSIENENIPIEIEKERIFQYKSALILNKKHPLAQKKIISKKDIKKYPYLFRDKFSFYDIRKFSYYNISNISFENATQEMTIGFVAENIDMTGLPQILLENNSIELNKNMVFKNIDHLLPTLSYSLFYLKNFINKNSAQFLIDNIRKDKENIYK